MAAMEPSAIGRLAPGGPWIGFARAAGGQYRLVRGEGAESEVVATDAARLRGDLLAMAVAYFAEVFAESPPDLEATQADVAELLRWLTQTAPDLAQRAQLQEALDGVDDGLAADVLIARLTAALAATDPGQPVDPVERLVVRYRP